MSIRYLFLYALMLDGGLCCGFDSACRWTSLTFVQLGTLVDLRHTHLTLGRRPQNPFQQTVDLIPSYSLRPEQ